MMTKKQIKLLLILLLASSALTGCSTRKDKMLPAGNNSMLDIWHKGASTTNATREGRTILRRS
ncbi:TIGR03751 family conjugal transfer lipoprotein, partial [Yersinia enterocolitica]